MLGVMLPIVAAPLPVGLAAGTLAAAARTAWLEGRGVARNLSLAGARIGPGDDRRCGLWLLNGNAVDVIAERAQRLDDRVAVGGEPRVGLVILDLQLDGKLPARCLEACRHGAELGRMQLDLERTHRLHGLRCQCRACRRRAGKAPALLAGNRGHDRGCVGAEYRHGGSRNSLLADERNLCGRGLRFDAPRLRSGFGAAAVA